MLTFFDYTYYLICKVYKRAKDSSPEFVAICVISLLYVLNAFALFFIVTLSIGYKIAINKWLIVLLYILFITINVIRYNKIPYDFLDGKWKNESMRFKKRKKLLVIAYFIVTVFLVFALLFRKELFGSNI